MSNFKVVTGELEIIQGIEEELIVEDLVFFINVYQLNLLMWKVFPGTEIIIIHLFF